MQVHASGWPNETQVERKSVWPGLNNGVLYGAPMLDAMLMGGKNVTKMGERDRTKALVWPLPVKVLLLLVLLLTNGTACSFICSTYSLTGLVLDKK